jgi:hypothetical protein
LLSGGAREKRGIVGWKKEIRIREEVGPTVRSRLNIASWPRSPGKKLFVCNMY